MVAKPEQTICPDENTVAAFFQGLLSESEARRLDEHVDRCAGCRGWFSQLARSMPPGPQASADPAQGDQDPWVSGPPPQLGQSYRIVRKIGEGGMATVYEVAHTRVERRLAVKVLHGRLARDPQMLARFDREARIGSRLGHEHIVQVVDFDRTAEGQAYLVMELLEGEPLDMLLQRIPCCPLDWSVALLRQVGSALSAAHGHGVVHRDLKPGNVFLCGQPQTHLLSKVLDFGLVKISSSTSLVTRDSVVMGTPWYMAPEQARGQGERIDAHTDIYALGVMLYQMLSGQVPFAAADIPAVLYQVVHEQPTPLGELAPQLPAAVVELVERAMHKDPAQRPATATALLADLKRAVEPEVWGRAVAWGQREDERAMPVSWPLQSASRVVVDPLTPTSVAADAICPTPTPRRDWFGSGDAAVQGSASASMPRRLRVARMVWAGLAALALVGFGALWVLRNGPDPAAADTVQPLPSGVGAQSSPSRAQPRRVSTHGTSTITASSRDTALAAAPSASASPAPPVRLLSVQSNPAGARVLVDGSSRGTTPVTGLAISAASHVITLAKPGFRPARRRLRADKGAAALRVDLSARPATLVVVWLREGQGFVGDVHLNGQRVDDTPAVISGLEPGRHTVYLSRGSLRTEARSIVLKPGQRRRVVFGQGGDDGD